MFNGRSMIFYLAPIPASGNALASRCPAARRRLDGRSCLQSAVLLRCQCAQRRVPESDQYPGTFRNSYISALRLQPVVDGLVEERLPRSTTSADEVALSCGVFVIVLDVFFDLVEDGLLIVIEHLKCKYEPCPEPNEFTFSISSKRSLNLSMFSLTTRSSKESIGKLSRSISEYMKLPF